MTVAVVRQAPSKAEQNIAAAWKAYRETEKYGLRFGKVCCEWRDEFGAQGSRTGGGLRPILDKVGIPKSTAYWWMEQYEISIGVKKRLDVHYSSESDDWTTPPEIIERTQKTLGQIDLDPCSPEVPTIPAAHTFTKDADGLRFDWCGKVYMNPPYGREIGAWVEKLAAEYRAARTKEAVALVPARVDTDWFRTFRDFAVCFIDGRLKFSGHSNSAPFPSCVIYLGKNIARFQEAFSDMGDVWMRWRR